jgi:hypothetical protein
MAAFRHSFAMVNLLDADSYFQGSNRPDDDVSTDDDMPALVAPPAAAAPAAVKANATAKANVAQPAVTKSHQFNATANAAQPAVAVPATSPSPPAVPAAGAGRLAGVKVALGRMAASPFKFVKNPCTPPVTTYGMEAVSLDLPGGVLLAVADNRACARAKCKATSVVPRRPPLTVEQRRECDNLRSKAYQSTRKATNDTGLAAFAGMRAKNEYLKSLGYGFTSAVRGPGQPNAKAANVKAKHRATQKAKLKAAGESNHGRVACT